MCCLALFYVRIFENLYDFISCPSEYEMVVSAISKCHLRRRTGETETTGEMPLIVIS